MKHCCGFFSKMIVKNTERVADEGSKQVYLVENGAVETHTPFVL